MSEIKFDEVPEHYKKFVVFDFNGSRLGWVMHETDWQAVEAWNDLHEDFSDGHATSALGPR